MKLLQMSLAGGVMILVITVIRALAIERLPKKTFLALWAAALAPSRPCRFFRRKQGQQLLLRSRQLPRLRRRPRSGRSSGL